MLKNIQPEEILFIDIETVPGTQDFNSLDEDFQLLWTEKSRFMREKNNIDIEESYHSAGIYAEFGKIICIGAGYFTSRSGGYEFRSTSFSGDDENAILSDFAMLLNKRFNDPFKLLCAHNGKEFDFPYLSRRMLIHGIELPEMLDTAGKKPWEIQHLDTMELWKFGDYKNYTSLKLLARLFGIPTPKDDIDGSMVREVYYTERDIDRIDRYCRKDVLTVAQLFLKYKGLPLIPAEKVTEV